MKTIHNWIAVAAILAVAMLGVVAVDRNADHRIETQRESLVNICVRQNEARMAANSAIHHLNDTAKALDKALVVAQGEKNQRQRDQIAYAEARAILAAHNEIISLPTIDCQKEIPKP